ncbi:PDR/VanB family oxidoreductase [Amycolatopsis pithecellobii]|uniref:2Fe-2S iron-sulfur cluster binding domain-containing protein n=1 Tax=Amycolatopsis pithecellobii TaxID=664692 RepID=A0A6N7Z5Q8_9PSEU|nr:PDR/VanB family oxidoreductase [Amycolatopsis pithecellobii]MTD57039.1 2Fe-2S iron-sulfur cluster binding domain-containing protein [Amycolatopsis pithecellobii]
MTVEIGQTTDVVVKQLRLEAEDVYSLELVPLDGGELPSWEPGSHVDVALPNGLVRQYSLSGDPQDRRRWRLGVLNEPDSRGGSRFISTTLRPGDKLSVGSPRNNFELTEAADYGFIAGGIGITPILPMIAAVRAAGARWSLTYGGRRRASMAFVDELAGYGAAVRMFAEDVHGRPPLTEIVASYAPGTAVYCCGPEGLLRAVEEVVRARPELTLHVERFAPKVVESSEVDGSFTVRLARTGTELRVARGESILDAVETAGLSVPNACREGICGSCETRVCGGVVDHRDSVLSPAEQATNDTMMICVSRARTAVLELDL